MSRDIKETGKWAWARWRDFNDVRDLFELFGWKTWVGTVLGGWGSYAWLYEPGNRPLAVIAIALVVIAMSAFSIASQKRLLAVKGNPWYKRWLLGGDGIPSGHTRLPEAARMFYEASKAGKLPTINAHISENLSGLTDNNTFVSGSPENILEWWAVYLSERLHIHGIRPPSTQHKEIPESDVKRFYFLEGAEKLKDPLNDNVFYTNLTVETERLQAQYEMQSSYYQEN